MYVAITSSYLRDRGVTKAAALAVTEAAEVPAEQQQQAAEYKATAADKTATKRRQ